LITRAILDHIPPLFGFRTFKEVNGQHAAGRSFKSIAEFLDSSARKVADQHLHEPIRRKEMLPTSVQVDVHQQLDFILAEAVRHVVQAG